MTDRVELAIWLAIWVLVCGWLVRSQWNRKLPSIGLPLAYLLSLSMIHFAGALIYALPWYQPRSAILVQSGYSYSRVLSGFIESLYGVLGFGLGSTLLAYWAIRFFKPGWLKDFQSDPDLKLPKKLLITGAVFSFLLFPTLGRIPGFQAISVSGVYLIVVGLCLACWKTWYTKDRKELLLWLGISSCLPLITLIALGFIGYGATATLLIFIFVSSFYRPRWHTLIIACLIFALGLSVYVTYIRDRTLIRNTVWGGQDFTSRYERIAKTILNFELIDFSNQRHLEAIDVRLNQNILVGQAVEYIEAGSANFAEGETLWKAAIAPIPRLLWPGKPIYGGSGNLVSFYTGQKFADGTSVGIGQVLEFYINFGSIGVFVGFLIMGMVIRIIDLTAAYKLQCGNWLGFTSWFTPGLALLQPGGSLVEVTAAFASSVVLVIIVRIVIPNNSTPRPNYDDYTGLNSGKVYR